MRLRKGVVQGHDGIHGTKADGQDQVTSDEKSKM